MVVAPRPVGMAAMVMQHAALHVARIVLLLSLSLLAVNLPATLHQLIAGGADMFKVSPFLLPALLFKAVLLSINLLLLWLAHRALARVRDRTAAIPESSRGVHP